MGDKRDTTWLPLAAAAALHVALVLVLGHWRAPNLWENGAIADALVAGHGFAVAADEGFEPTSWQAPAYPLLLAGLWSLLGKGPAAHLTLSLLQALLTASVVVPLGGLATRWSGPAAGVAARWLAVLLPLHAWYSTRLHHTALDLALAPWVLLALARLRDDGRRPRDLVVAGASLAALGLLQPVLLAALGAFALLLAASDRRCARAIALALAVAVALLLPWTVRNALVHGRLMPIKDSLGKELWIGNNPHATGTAYLPGGLVAVEELHPPACAATHRDRPEAERFAAMGAEARAWIAAEPAAFAGLTARRLLWLWSWPPADLVRHGLGGEALVYRWGHVAAWLGLVGLALLGGRPSREPLLALAALFGVASLIYGTTQVGQARFRGEVEFVLVPLAAAGLLRLLSLARAGAPGGGGGPAPASPSPGAS